MFNRTAICLSSGLSDMGNYVMIILAIFIIAAIIATVGTVLIDEILG